MALDFSLEIATDLESAQALQFLADTQSFQWTDQTYVIGAGVWVSACAESDLRRSVIEDAFHFSPTLSVGWRIQPKEAYQEGLHTLLQAAMALLTHTSGDAVLLFNGEELVLQRLGGQLVLNADWNQWPASQRAVITLPYELRALASPLS